MFSRIHEWSADDPLSHLILASLDIGVRFEGTIDPAVPRPIKNGRVVACATTPANSVRQSSAMVWTDVVPIQEDGSFLFPSMPRDCDLQIVSLCDGWRSALPDAEDNTRMNARYGGSLTPTPRFSSGQTWLLERDVVKKTLRMTPTGSCRIRCLKADGTPLAGANVASYPNHYFHGGGSQVFAVSRRTADILKSGRFDYQIPLEYTGITDIDGRATIRDLPPGPNSFGVRDHRIVSPDKNGEATAIVELDNTTEKTVTVERLPD
jgi:hypothetical protein